jgi:cell division protein FtsL
MDKRPHKDIGKQFSEEINSMSQQPRGHIWENIEKQLDKTDVKNYRDKFTQLRKKAFLLLVLFIGFLAYLIIYVATVKYKTSNNRVATKESMGQITNQQTNNTIAAKHGDELIKQAVPTQTTKDIFTAKGEVGDATLEIVVHDKVRLATKEKALIKITNGNTGEVEPLPIYELSTFVNTLRRQQFQPTVIGVIAAPAMRIKNENPINSFFKKDSFSMSKYNQPAKSNYKQDNYGTKFTITAFAGPSYSAYHLENDEVNNYDNKNGIANREQSDLSVSGGVLLGYNINHSLSIHLGLMYSASNINIDPTKIYAENDNAGSIKYRYNTSSGYGYLLPSFSASPAVGDSLFANGANHTLRYVTVPLMLKHKLGNKKLTFHPGLGLLFNFLTKASLTTDVQDRFNREREYITKIEGIKKFGTSVLLSPEVQYQLSKKWSISAMPYFKYSLGSINKGTIVKTYPYTVGLGLGAVHKF